MKRLIYIALLLFKGVLAFNQTTTVDSLLTVLKTAKEDTNKVNTLIQLSEKAGWRVGNYDTALYYAQNAHTLAEKLGFKKGIASSYNNIGIVYYYQDDFASAMEYHLKSLKIREELGLKSNMAGSYANIGMVYYEQGDYARAMEYYLKALKIYEELGMKSNMAISYNNIGGIYYDQVDYSSAMEYYLKALKIREELGIKSDMTYSYNNIGNVYYDQGDYVRAMEYQLKALKIYEDMGMKSSMAVSYNNIGAIYSAQGDDASAMEYFFKALKIRKELGLKSGLAISYISIGTIYYDQRHIVLALQYVAKGLALAEETGHVMWIRDASDLLYNIHKKQGNYKEALKMHELYILMRDSMQNEETYKTTMQQAFRYEQDKKAVADSIKAAEAEKVHLANLEVEKTKTAAQKRQNIFLYVGLGLVALFGLFMFNRFRVTQKQKIIIEEKEKETSLQKHVIEEKHKEITDSINYAERIQRSFLATKEILDKNLGEYFVFFKPKDVVSGDFYWAASILSSSAVENHLSVSTPLDVTPPSTSSNATTKPVSSSEVENNSSSSAVENFILATADSTGHGVPGAIMSLLNITSLEKAIETETEPHHILNKTRQIIIDRLKKDGSPEGGKDGMECSLLVFNKDKTKLQIAAANNPVWIVRTVTSGKENNVSSSTTTKPVSSSEVENDNNHISTSLDVTVRTHEVIEIKPDKMPVGKHDKQHIPFTLHEYDLQKGDVVYTLTDGFPDQFGGEKGKKFMSKKLRELLAANAHLPMREQKQLLETTFTNWKKDVEQVDDVTVIGVRI